MMDNLKSFFGIKPHCNCGKKNEYKFKILEVSVTDSFTLTIQDGCTVCNACETSCPLIFDVKEDGVKFRKDYERHLKNEIENIKMAVYGYPCEVIKLVENE